MGHVEGLVSPARFAHTFGLEGEPDRDPDAFRERMDAIAKAEAAGHGWLLVGGPAHERYVYQRHVITATYTKLAPCAIGDATLLSVTWTWPPEMVV